MSLGAVVSQLLHLFAPCALHFCSTVHCLCWHLSDEQNKLDWIYASMTVTLRVDYVPNPKPNNIECGGYASLGNHCVAQKLITSSSLKCAYTQLTLIGFRLANACPQDHCIYASNHGNSISWSACSQTPFRSRGGEAAGAVLWPVRKNRDESSRFSATAFAASDWSSAFPWSD